MANRARLSSYLAGAIEAVSNSEMMGWREDLKNKLQSPNLLIYDPVAQESKKVGKSSGQQVEYIKGLKKAGKWDLFYSSMWRIWFGSIDENKDIIHCLDMLRIRKHVDGNYERDLEFWGDAEAVIRSDFIIVYMPKDIKTVGTIYEIMLAFLYHVPIYLILPDATKTDTNSSLLFGVMISNGEVFYNVNDCIRFIKEKHKIDTIDKE